MSDEKAYTIHAGVTTITIIVLSIIFNLFTPFNLIEYFIYFLQLPIYLISRSKIKNPLHDKGLIKCYLKTTLFYILIFSMIKLSFILVKTNYAFILASSITILSCIFTSENKRLYFGYRNNNEPSKYQSLIDFLKYESSTDKYNDYLKVEEDLKTRVSTKTYLIYKRKFIDNKTFSEISDEFEIDNRNIVHELDKCYFYICGRIGL